MKITTEAKLLTAESKPYKMQGNEGVSHRLRFNIDGEIYACKSNAEQVRTLQDSIGKEGTVELSLESRKENLALACLSFE